MIIKIGKAYTPNSKVLICGLLGHKWGKFDLNNDIYWIRDCKRCLAIQHAGTAKRPNYRNLTIQ